MVLITLITRDDDPDYVLVRVPVIVVQIRAASGCGCGSGRCRRHQRSGWFPQISKYLKRVDVQHRSKHRDIVHILCAGNVQLLSPPDTLWSVCSRPC